MPEAHLRASDADRAAVAEVLGAHMSAGRLTVAEYDERLAAAYGARTYGELAALTTDLPTASAAASGASAQPVPASRHQPAACGPGWGSWGGIGAMGAMGAWAGGSTARSAWAGWLTTALIVLTIWAATSIGSGEWRYPWPIWVIGPWGAVLLAQSLTGRRGSGDRQLEGPAR